MKNHFKIRKSDTNSYPWINNRIFATINLTEYFEIKDNKYDIKYVSNKGGKEYKETFEKNISEYVEEPLFAVIDTNKAHHLTYFLVTEAMKKRGIDDCTVINIDQHPDGKNNSAANANWKSFFCGNWGSYFGENINYYSLYNKMGKKLDPKKQELPVLLNDITLNENDNIYITIDLDVLKGAGRTDYGEGTLTLDELQKIIQSIGAQIKNKNLKVIGADVIGLPPENNKQYIEAAYKVIEALGTASGLLT